MTPLAMAALYGSAPIVDRLLKAGADVKARRPQRRNDADVRGAQRPSRGAEAAGRSRRRRQREGAAARHHGVDVGGRAEATRRRSSVLLAAGADHSAKSAGAGLPRNYLAPRVNTRAVEEAQQRRVSAPGRRAHLRAAARVGVREQHRPRRRAQRVHSPNRARGGGAGAAGARRAWCARLLRAAAAAAAAGCRPAAAAGAAAAARGAPAGTPGRRMPTTTPKSSSPAWWAAAAAGSRRSSFAAREGDLESARLLLDGGADVNQPTEYGWTPLLTAVNNRNYQAGAAADRAGRRRQPGQQGRLDAALPGRRTTATSKAATIRCRRPTWITSS